MEFWEIIEKILQGNDLTSEQKEHLIEYNPEMIQMYNYIITAHTADDNSRLTVSFFKPEQWEMVLSTSIIMGTNAESVVRNLGPDDIKQLVIPSGDWDSEDDLEDLF